jgi:hypothetical protein
LRPAPLVRTHADSAWSMAAHGKAYLVYSVTGEPVDLDLGGDPGVFTLAWVDPTDGAMHPATSSVSGGTTVTLSPPSSAAKHPWAAWLTRR